ncbi:hypothetical protein M9Y10_016470 [Tritrichomonas musculus]|uniref:Uncharacterized protein n=1 Tax=Tritrichomonas musculus TaxID=1915356 RepID=A0ABR2HWC0_9EUKA
MDSNQIQHTEFSFPISLEMQDFLESINKFSEDYTNYINESKYTIDSCSSEDEAAIQNMRLIYYHMHIENDKLKEFIDELKYFTYDKRWVTYGPSPLHSSNEYPTYQTFNNFSSTIA